MQTLKPLIRIALLLALLFSLGSHPVLADDSPPIVPAAQVTPPPEDAQSTSGPTPPAGWSLRVNEVPTVAAATLNVPAYLWTHGCGPTAAGMVMAYWDQSPRIYSQLFPSSSNSSVQDSGINEFIASSTQTRSHYNDYARPLENGSGLRADNYIVSGYTPHADNSLADFMLTSRSTRGNQYGWGYFSDVRPALIAYVNFINVRYRRFYGVQSSNYFYSNTLWAAYRAEIDAGRPVIFLVDSNADGQTDHFVTGTGYGTNSSGQPIYRFNDTWSTSQENWAVFRSLTNGQPWGIYGMTTFQITGNDTPVVLDKFLRIPMVIR